MSERPRIGILTVSDRAAAGVYEDRSGPEVRSYLEGRIAEELDFAAHLVADDRTAVERALEELVAGGCCWIVTTGGTGVAQRDVTPEATQAVCDRILPGFGEAMRRASYETVPSAVLSRQTAGVRGRCLIVNLPGSPKAIAECLDAVLAAVPHGVRLLGGPELTLVGGEDDAVPEHGLP